MSGTRVPTNPPASYDQRWMQLFWDWVRSNRAGYTGTSGLTLTGDVKGTGLVPGTLTSTLGTTGVAAGTYGGANVIPAFTVDAKGRLLTATNAGTAGASTAIGTFTGAVVGTGTFPGGPTGFTFTPNPAFTGTGTAAGWLVSGTSTAAMYQSGTATGGFARWGTSSQSLVQAGAVGVTGTGTFGGVLSTRALSGAVGSSDSQSNAMISPYVNAVPISTTLGGTLMAYGVPASALAGSGQGFEFTAWGTAGIGVVGGLALRFGTAILINGTSTIAPSGWVFEGQVVAQSGTQQQYFARFAAFTNNGVGVEQINIGTLGMTLTTLSTLCVSGTGTNSNARTQFGMSVKFMGLQ